MLHSRWFSRLPSTALCAAALACLAGATAGSSAATAAEPIKIGVYGPMTGGSSPMGLSMRDGVRLAADEINARGGVLGRPIEIVERDDQATNERGAQVMQDLISNQKVVAVLGPINTGVALASYKYPMEAKVPLLINVSAGAPVNELFKDNPDNYVFRIAASDIIQAEMIVSEAVDKRGFKKVAFLCDDTNYGQNGCNKMEAAIESRSLKPVYTGKFKIKDTDMTPQLQQARSAGAQALLVYGIGPELAQIANGMQKLGYKVPMIGSWTLSMSNFIDAAGANGNGATMPQTFIQNGAKSAKAKKFIADYQKKYGVDRIPSAVAAAQGYDSMYVLAQAIEQAGSTDGPKIKAALESLQKPYVGAIAAFQKPFSATDHEAIHKPQVVMGVVQAGQVHPPQGPRAVKP
ncbi:MAG TPA: ABC transporter substrate-binding protein [Thermoanaerobaculia bacterium]|nr:ABC transporter substrate-binding protein [Thermoanaerobaculia bacterium]